MIPLSEYKSYFDIYNIESEEERRDILYFCGAMDNAYVAHCTEKQKEKHK